MNLQIFGSFIAGITKHSVGRWNPTALFVLTSAVVTCKITQLLVYYHANICHIILTMRLDK